MTGREFLIAVSNGSVDVLDVLLSLLVEIHPSLRDLLPPEVLRQV
jgi:hypothetical protein